MMEEQQRDVREVHNHFAEGSNCQVFNGNISGCVFAMPGSTVNQYTREMKAEEVACTDARAGLAAALAPVFYGNAEAASTFLESIRGAKPTQVTALVNQWVEEKKISALSCHRDLWLALHEAGLYAPSESNWNQQVK